MTKLTYIAKVVDGSLVLDREAFVKALKTLDSGVYDLVLHKHRGGRSNSQNSYYWGVVLPLLSEYLGYSCEEMHEICRFKFLRVRRLIAGEDIEVGSSTTKLNTKEFQDYLENIRRWGAGLGVNIPEPNEAQEEFK
jgi:hypothetical protein